MKYFIWSILLPGRSRAKERGWSDSVEDDSTLFASDRYHPSIFDRSIDFAFRLAAFVPIWMAGGRDRRQG